MNKLRILILGSAPNATVPCADIVYCANGAVNYYAGEISSIPKIITVVGSHLISGINSSSAPMSLKQVREGIFNSKMHEMLVLEHRPWFAGWSLDKGMQDVENILRIKPELITFSQRIELLGITAELKEPILSHTLLTEAIRMKPVQFLPLSKYLLRQLRKQWFKKSTEANPVFRPSTGMWAAIAAMHKYGLGAKYLFSGIGLESSSNRSIHGNGSSQGQFEHLTHHLHADIRTFNALKHKYDVEYIHRDG